MQGYVIFFGMPTSSSKSRQAPISEGDSRSRTLALVMHLVFNSTRRPPHPCVCVLRTHGELPILFSPEGRRVHQRTIVRDFLLWLHSGGAIRRVAFPFQRRAWRPFGMGKQSHYPIPDTAHGGPACILGDVGDPSNKTQTNSLKKKSAVVPVVCGSMCVHGFAQL